MTVPLCKVWASALTSILPGWANLARPYGSSGRGCHGINAQRSPPGLVGKAGLCRLHRMVTMIRLKADKPGGSSAIHASCCQCQEAQCQLLKNPQRTSLVGGNYMGVHYTPSEMPPCQVKQGGGEAGKQLSNSIPFEATGLPGICTDLSR